jgi:arginyl-tRNA synthetase
MNLILDFQSKVETSLKELKKSKKIILPKTLKGLSIKLPPKDQSGDLACNVSMILSKINKKSPIELANLFKEYFLKNFPEISKIQIAKPGFLNITFKTIFWKNFLFDVIKLNSNYGSKKSIKKKINVEFVSANPTGPLHVGHCRGAILGDVISNLLIFNGHDVVKEYYVNDYGSQVKNFVKSVYFRILEILKKKEFPYKEDLYPGDYIIDIAKKIISEKKISNFDNFEKIYKILEVESLNFSLDLIKENLSILGIQHDNFVHESDLIKKNFVEKTINHLKKNNHVYLGKLIAPKVENKETWVPREQLLFKSTNFGDDMDRALQKEDNTWTYFAGDIGYHANKIERNFDSLISILGADHSGYIKRIISAVSAISNKKVNLDCKVSQLVKLFKDGKPFKMSKRKGDYITVEDLVNEVGKDSVRFMMLNRSNDVELDFDFKKVTDHSKENPVFYVQYAFARINSIFRLLNLNIKEKIDIKNEKFNLNEHEVEIIKKISEWPNCIEVSLSKLEPHIIPYYLYELSTLFHSYWNMGNENKKYRFVENNKIVSSARLVLLQALSIVITNGMNILGVSTPKKM